MQIFTNFATNAIKYTPQGEIVMGYECMPWTGKNLCKKIVASEYRRRKEPYLQSFREIRTLFAQGQPA